MENEVTEEMLDTPEQPADEGSDEPSIDDSSSVQELREQLSDLSKKFEDQKSWNESLSKKINTKKDTPQSKKEVSSEPSHADDRLDKMETMFDLSQEGYSKEEAKDLMAFASAKGITVEEAKDNPFMKSGIEAVRKERASAAKTPSSSGRSPASGSVDFRKAIGSDKASKADKQRAFTERMAQRSGSRVSE